MPLPHVDGDPGFVAWANGVDTTLGGLSATYVPSVVLTGAGIDPTGATDSTTAIQAKLDSLPTAGGMAFLPAGTFLVTGVTLNKRTTLFGVGAGSDTLTGGSKIVCASTTANAVTVAVDGCNIRDITIANTSGTTPTAGAGILIGSGSHSHLDSITVSGFYVNIEVGTNAGYYWTLTNSFILDPVMHGMWLHNTKPTYDWSDPSITGCTFTNYNLRNPLGAAFYWQSGGGIRFENNKINSGPRALGALGGRFVNGLEFAAADGTATVDIFVLGCSIENVSGRGLMVRQQGPLFTGMLTQIVVANNEFGYNGYGVHFEANTVPNYICSVIVANNIFTGIPHNGIFAQNVYGITLGNNFFTEVGGTTPDECVRLGAGVLQRQVEQQNIKGDNLSLFYDEGGNDAATHGPYAGTALTFDRDLPATTSTSVYTTLWKLTYGQYCGGIIEVSLGGSVVNSGGFAANVKRAYTRQSALTLALATIGTDTLVYAGATASFDLLLDVTTVPGSILVKIKLDPATGGTTDIVGDATMSLSGRGLISVRKGA